MIASAPGPESVVAVVGRGVAPPDTPLLTADDAGVTRGDGCFEGLLLRDGEVLELDRHLARMARSAAALDIAFDPAAFATTAKEAAAAWSPTGEAAVKFVLTRGPASTGVPTGYVTITALGPDTARLRRDGARVITVSRGVTADAFADAPWLLGGVKTLSYAVNMAAQREAVRRGVDDVVLTAVDGTVLEAPTAAVVWASGRSLTTTPTGATGILASTTQALLFEQAAAAGWTVGGRLVRIDDLHAADALWLVSSVRGPVEVVELDGRARERRPDLHAEVARLAGF
ncbi:MAG: aminodeoxychorismate lyase [Jatrophihabitans sp.]|uniref:aminodeoxychorismate lyase n=1 Tax=Jatrophihabitans sp. TaxID=1932789 RepID=UPI003F809DD3